MRCDNHLGRLASNQLSCLVARIMKRSGLVIGWFRAELQLQRSLS